MFEMIGLLLGFAVCMGLGLIISAILGILAWLLSTRARLFLALSAAALPVLCVMYLFLCGAILPNESLFGDISQPLPNGYALHALGKMPDFAGIGRGSDLSSEEVGLTECIGSLGVYGPVVAGQYSHPCTTFDPHPNEAYFLFDTRTAKNQDFATKAALESAIGQPVVLVQVPYFQSQEPTYRRQRRIDGAICFGPMILAFMLLVVMILGSRYSKRPVR